MRSTARFTLLVFLFAALLLAACGSPAATSQPQSAEMPAAPDVYKQSTGQEAPAPQPEVSGVANAAPAAGGAAGGSDTASTTKDNTTMGNVTVQTGTDSLVIAQSDRKIIKNADIKLLVEKTDTAIDRGMQVVGDVGGYIISSRVWFQETNGENYKFSSMTIGVPVDQFENAMRRLRGLALRVLDENATGEDVTSEYVDLQSQLVNLESTTERIRAFLKDAKTVDESLRINQELTNMEGQIEQVKGRMNFLANRSAYSTITVTFEPDIPPLPTPTVTPTSTPIPTATPKSWNPGETVQRAGGAVTGIYQGLVELGIWFAMVIIPLLAPPVLLIWGIYKLVTRKSKKP